MMKKLSSALTLAFVWVLVVIGITLWWLFRKNTKEDNEDEG